MKLAVLLVALGLLSLVACQSNVVLYTIDSFTTFTSTLVLSVETAAPPEQLKSNFTVTDTVFGGERDIQLVVENAPVGRVFTAGVSSGQFVVTAGSGNSSDKAYGLLQYDGADNGNVAVDTDGAIGDANSDFTANGAFAIVLQMESDFSTTAEITVYSGQTVNDFCQAVVTVPTGSVSTNIVANFSSFTRVGAGCDFTRVGAIELAINTRANIDAIVDLFGTFGPGAVTPTRTPTPTPTRTPSACFCECGNYHCVLEADNDGFNTFFETSILRSDGNNEEIVYVTKTVTKSSSSILSASILLLALVIAVFA